MHTQLMALGPWEPQEEHDEQTGGRDGDVEVKASRPRSRGQVLGSALGTARTSLAVGHQCWHPLAVPVQMGNLSQDTA